jgi:error-prone DNA polymerase
VKLPVFSTVTLPSFPRRRESRGGEKGRGSLSLDGRGKGEGEASACPLTLTLSHGGEREKVEERHQDALRLGILNVMGLGDASARAIEAGREKGGAFQSIGDFLERTGVLEEVALNLASAGAFDALEPNRRKVKWEIGLRYRPVNSQLPLPLPVTQDMLELPRPGAWESMQDEYSVLSLYPGGHVMARLRPRLKGRLCTSKDIEKLGDGAAVTTAGLVIRRQRPRGKVVFITLEDEFGHVPCMVFPRVYEKNEHRFKEPFLVVKGRLNRREGTHNLVINQVKSFSALDKVPGSKDFR